MHAQVIGWLCINIIFSLYNLISSAINHLMENSEEEVIYLLRSFCEKMQLNVQNADFVDGISAEALARICSYLQGTINKAINDIAHCDVSCEIDERKLALLWGVVDCYSYMSVVNANPSLSVDLVDAVDQLLRVKPGTFLFLYVSNMIFFFLPCRTLCLWLY